jgi:ribosomal protein L35AE/L33A
MSTSPKLAGVAIGDYVTIVNAYGREVRGRVVEVHGDGHCTLATGDAQQLNLRADESNTVRVERRPIDST